MFVILFVIFVYVDSLISVAIATLLRRKTEKQVCFVARHAFDTLNLLAFRWKLCSNCQSGFCYRRCAPERLVSQYFLSPIIRNLIKIVKEVKDALLRCKRADNSDNRNCN